MVLKSFLLNKSKFLGQVQFPARGWLRQVREHDTESRSQDLRYLQPARQRLDQGQYQPPLSRVDPNLYSEIGWIRNHRALILLIFRKCFHLPYLELRKAFV